MIIKLYPWVKNNTSLFPESTFMTSFQTGQILATPGALEALSESSHSPAEFIDRHCNCDFGDLSEEDRHMNEMALVDGSRIFYAYKTRNDTKIWIITEAEDDDGVRCETTILLPEEY